MGDRIDLEPYGIRLVLQRGMSLEAETLGAAKLHQGSFSQSQGRFDFPSGTYSLGPILGAGTYGTTYQAIHTVDNRVYAVKVIGMRSDMDMVRSTIKESILNILMEQESKGEVDGPYVPRFYELALDPVRNLLLMRTERIHGTLDNLYNAATPDQNDIYVPETLGNIAHILNFFYTRFQYNHRDLKADNVGYVYTPAETYQVKLIDFGMSCLTWKGVQIRGEQYFGITDPCFIPSRDLTQYIYEILFDFRPRFSAKLVALLEDTLTFPLDRRICQLFKGCRYKQEVLKKGDWNPLYDFLNNTQVKNPKAVPKQIYAQMLEFLGQEVPKKTSPITSAERVSAMPIKRCLPEQILNPRTLRCVRRSGKVGRKLMLETQRRTPSPTKCRRSKTRKACPQRLPKPSSELKPCGPDQTRNPVTRRCREKCPSSQIRNPATGRCVSRYGPLGRKLKAEGVVTSHRPFAF